jgi:hypothetical protein
MKMMREYLNQRYRVVGRVVVPLLFAGLIAPDLLQGVTWVPQWVLSTTFPVAIVISHGPQSKMALLGLWQEHVRRKRELLFPAGSAVAQIGS